MYKTMRKLDSRDQSINVIEYIVLKNLWEIYVFESKKLDNGDIEYLTLTVGHATEMGSQWESELAPYIMDRTTNLADIAPAPDWEWVSERAA